MARAILADITSDFVPEIKPCGSASNCYCITCTRKRATLFKLFTAWKQLNSASVKYDTAMKWKGRQGFELTYGTSCFEFNALVPITGDVIAQLIIRYLNAPSAAVINNEWLCCNMVHPHWLNHSMVLTYWDENNGFSSIRWLHMPRRKLFQMFRESEEAAIRDEMKDKFKMLQRQLVRVKDGKHVNNVILLSSASVTLPDTLISNEVSTRTGIQYPLEVTFGSIGVGHHALGLWALFWWYYEDLFNNNAM